MAPRIVAALAIVVFATPLGAQSASPQAAPAAQAPPAGRASGPGVLRGGYTEAATLPARIMAFTAQPAVIKPGESVVLNWAVENPRTVTIAPDVGRATVRGPLRVSPNVTTTYTLTVTGVNGTLTRDVTVTVTGTKPVAAAAPGTPLSVPRTADGKPDLSGVYGYGVGPGRGAPPPAPGSLPTAPTLKDEKYRVVRGPTDTGQYATCRPPGVPQTFFVPYYTQIIQAPNHVVILHEYLNLPRIVLLNAEQPVDPDPFYMGHSVGKWDGDTLVVDSVGFKESEVNGIKTTEDLHLVERFRRPTHDTLEYEVVIEDPNVFAAPWRIVRSFPLLPEHKRVDEFFCENNRDYKPLFGK